MSNVNGIETESTVAEKISNSSLEQNNNHSPQSQSSENQKLVEAKTAVILLKDSRLCTKNEYTQWLLKILYQPCTRKDSEAMNVLYLSRNRRKIWATDFSIHQDPSRAETVKKNMDQLYVITPKTSIMTIAQENRLVYIIDLSSSLSTVGNTRADILLSKVFQTLKNSLESLVQPFSMQVTPTEKVIIQPSIRLTVMADCSQFASNVNVIRMLVEHPTMSVFIQNVIITANNVQTIIRKLQSEFLNFQEATVQFRKEMKKKRENMDYNLDVGTEVAPPGVGVFDSVPYPKKKPVSVDSTPVIQQDSPRKENRPPLLRSMSEFDLSTKPKDASFHSFKKEVWGIGKSGANLSRILHAGHFALKLLTPQGRAQLILITDGAMKSNVHDNTFVRQFAEEDITCHVIQIGYASGFIPGRNFGFVPDTEILQFLARATHGTFMYSDACTPKLNPDTLFYDLDPTDTPSSTKTHPILQFVDLRKASHIQTPNIFHRQFLFREVILSRHHADSRLQAEGDSQGQLRRELGGMLEGSNDPLKERYNFPWDPYARAPEGDWRLLKFREYTLPSEFSHIIAARAREGFIVQSVTFDDGSKHLDVAIRDLEVPDLTAVKKERIQIVMVMRWQPNIIIEYRIKATWLPTIIGNTSSAYSSEDILMSCNIFSRGKAPRAEIFVRTDVGFAHMLQNWDMLKRRAQMMGVVTGSSQFGEAYASPVYSKIDRLKTYLVDMYEGDEVLRTIIGFPSKFWLNAVTNNADLATPPAGSSDHRASTSNKHYTSQHMGSYVDSFKEVWEKINLSDTRGRTRCWYDPGCIDLLVGDVSPFMTPKLLSAYNEEFVLNVEEEILIMLNHVKDIVREWSHFESGDGTFVKIIHKMLSVHGATPEEPKDIFSPTLSYPPSFCELRVRHEYGRLITLRLLFFNVEVITRKKIIENLTLHIKQSQHVKSSCTMICKRPFSRMLMRDKVHFADVTTTTPNNEIKIRPAGNLTANQSRSKAWYLPVAMWLTSEYIVRDYLKHMTWLWQTDNRLDLYHKENKMMPIHDLAFQFLCQARLEQGYQLVSPFPDSAQFYQEVNIVDLEGKNSELCAIQYFLWKDSMTGKITTEIWMEPSSSFDNQFDLVKKKTFESDQKTISQLITFDKIHTVGRNKMVGDFKEKQKSLSNEPINTATILLPQLFDVASVLYNNRFVIASFPSPHYKMTLIPTSRQQVKLKSIHPEDTPQDISDHSGNSTPVIRNRPVHTKNPRHIRRQVHPTLIENTPTPEIHALFSFRPDPLLSKTKEIISKLDVVMQNYAVMHYFIERSLATISHGEILMTSHDQGTVFWQTLQAALQSVIEEGKISNTSLVSDLRKTRCFVQVFDPRSFVVILFPSLESVATYLGKDENSRQRSMVEQCRFLDIWMFECVRQKPMRPSKGGNESILNSIEVSDEISIKPVSCLVHESDGLGVLLRPNLFKGHFSACPPQAKLTERVLRVAQDVSQDYSRSFLKSVFASLVRGFMVDDDDLNKVLEVCNESLMEIDITEFVNTMTMQKQDSSESNEVQEQEIQAKFNAIFHQYFEHVQTNNKPVSNLFYYKPPFIRNDTSPNHTELSSQDDKIAFIVDLITFSETPLLLRLNVAYKTTSDDPDVANHETVLPIHSLPTSYLGQTLEGEKKLSYEENDGSVNLFASGSIHTKAYLQIVCLNLPSSFIDSYSLSDKLSPYSSNPIIQSMPSQPECFSSLSQDQKVALAETDCRLNWLLKEETIHGLLKAPTITLQTLKYIENQLKVPCPFLEYDTSIKVPFRFVKHPAESRTIFMNELEKDDKLRRVGDYFYIAEDPLFNLDSSYSSTASPLDSSRVSIHRSSEDEFCDGLGISLSKEDESFVTTVPTTIDKRPLYWLILIPHERSVQIYFYSKLPLSGARQDILNHVKEKINVIEERTNRLSLLNYLQETRICSKYLEIPSDPNTIYSEEEDSEEDSYSVELEDLYQEPIELNKFTLGQFACPLIFTKRFPLHWRLQPNVALKFLASDVLRLFTVINRPNMFVIEREGSIVYCKIYEENLDPEFEGSPSTIFGSPVHTLSGKPMEDDVLTLVENTPNKRDLAKSAVSPRPRMSSGGRLSPNEKRELVLEVYGVDLPDWIEVEFVNLIENRLVSQITLNEIQQFFVRNSTSKPTAADVDFILPTWKPFTVRKMLRVPNLVHNPYLLMQYFKQSLIADNIRPLASPYVRQVISNYYRNMFLTQEHDGVQDSIKRQTNSQKVYDIPPGSFCFYYNCIKRLPGISSALELSAGQGMAGICLTLLDVSGTPLTTVPDLTPPTFTPDEIHQCLEEEFREAKPGPTYHHIWVDIWVTGAVDSQALTDHIYACYRQSLCDYFIERTVSLDGLTLQEGSVVQTKFIESVLSILRKASELGSPTVCWMDRSIESNPWCMDDLIRFVDIELCKLDVTLKPTVAWTALPNDVWPLATSPTKWDLYRGFQYRQRQKLQSNIRVVAISGLDEFVERLGTDERRSSHHSDRSGESERRLQENRSFRYGPRLDAQKHCFLILTLDVDRLSIYTYNWSESVSHELFSGLGRLLERQSCRNAITLNILHQKMGLFHHTAGIKSVLDRFASDRFQSPKPKRPFDLKPPDRNPKRASLLDLKDLIAFPTTTPEADTDRLLLQKTQLDELDHALMDVIPESVADTIRSKDFDILRRHGQPFLETFLRRTRVHSAHRKALKVYLKWRYEQAGRERLTRPEVATIMRSSRVLHFCRTPLIFCDPEKEWGEGLNVMGWFRTMAGDLTGAYAHYLEGADMQLIDFAQSDHSSLSKASRFSVGKRLTADSLPTFLLRVFEGGSILCEVRLTKVFVSVTLYTLHRQYGRLDYKRFRPETRTKKRSNFKKFEKNSGHFKQMIHINSFVYDFQLAYLQRWLGKAEFDLIQFVRRAALASPSPYSKNRVIHGFYQVKEVSVLDQLFKQAQRYGLLPVWDGSVCTGLTVTSPDLSFCASERQSDWHYSLVLTMGPDQIIEYFILIVCQVQATPDTMTRISWVQSDPSKGFEDISLPEQGYTLADIISGARARLDQIVTEVIINSKRVENWSRLHSAHIKQGDHSELIEIIQEFDKVDLLESDESLARLFKLKLNWNVILNKLKRMMKSGIKDFQGGQDRHMLLYNARYMDYMIHLKLSQEEKLEGWMVSREKTKDKTIFTVAEKEQMLNLGKILYYNLWCILVDRQE